MVIKVSSKGDFSRTFRFMQRLQQIFKTSDLDKYGKQGVDALSSATPIDSGKTADSWTYKITTNANSVSIEWYNTNTNNGVNIAILLQYGHGTGSGGYVKGRDYINPAIRPVFDEIANNLWKEVNKT